MITQTGNRSCRRGRGSLFRIAIGAMILSMSGCAEIELGAEAYKTYARVNEPPPGPPVSPSPARQDSVDPSMRPDPGAFYAADLALWDGARTLPGIWIAHPMAKTARRVRLTNGETGVRVDAAMFRRDPGLSGPRIVVSSEAAERLGLAPGLATPITIEGLAYRVDNEAVVAGAEAEPVPAPVDVLAEETAGTPVEPERAPDGAGDITDGRHFIQAGTFVQPGNAALLVEKLRAADLPVTGLALTVGKRQFTRVLVGPYRTIAERDGALEAVRKLGPADATPARG